MAGMAGRTFQVSYTIPGLVLKIVNERSMIEKMTREVERLIKARTMRGLDSSYKPFAPPDDGGTPLEETGQLKRSIGSKVKRRKGRKSRKTGKTTRGRWVGVVRAFGRREMETSERRGRRSRAKAKTESMRAVAAADFARGIVRGDLGARVSKKTGKLALGRVKRHAITDNAHLAAVLSTEPKGGDKAKNRKTYRIFEASKKELDAATRILSKGRFTLVAVRRKRKRGS